MLLKEVINIKELRPDFSKLVCTKSGKELLPAVIQDANDLTNLMVGFMIEEAYEKTLETGKVTFWSRTRGEIWTKGEISGNFLEVASLQQDCDSDTLLIKAKAYGPTCHRPGMRSCFDS